MGESARSILAQQISSIDPFDQDTREVVKFQQRVRGHPYVGLQKSEVERFLKRKAGEWVRRKRY